MTSHPDKANALTCGHMARHDGEGVGPQFEGQLPAAQPHQPNDQPPRHSPADTWLAMTEKASAHSSKGSSPPHTPSSHRQRQRSMCHAMASSGVAPGGAGGPDSSGRSSPWYHDGKSTCTTQQHEKILQG